MHQMPIPITTAAGSSQRSVEPSVAQTAVDKLPTSPRPADAISHAGSRGKTVSNAGAARKPDGPAARRQMRRNTRLPLVPPKPKLFFAATSIFISRASLAQ